MNITEFLLARIAEDARFATEWEKRNGDQWYKAEWLFETVGEFNWDEAEHIEYWTPHKVFKECQAKLRIVTEIHRAGGPRTMDGDCGGCGQTDGYGIAIDDCPTLKLLALSYSDHPDYREEWTL